jgi:hypothetical protein
MFFGNPATVVRAKRSLLEFYLPPQNQFYKLEIPQNVFNFMEIVDESSFIKYIFDFLIKLNKKTANVDLVLDSDVIFEKTISCVNEGADKAAIEDFFSSVPLAQTNIVTKTNISDKQYFLYAANKSYFNSIVKAFAKFGWRVNYVTPLSIFGFNVQNQVLDDHDLKLIRNGKKLALKINFLEESQPKTIQ